MKTTEARKTSVAESKANQPFFHKGGNGLFSGERETGVGSFFSNKKPGYNFFTSNIIQPKLTIGQPHDQFEQEADHMADQVIVQGNGNDFFPSNKNGNSIQPKAINSHHFAKPVVQAKCDTCQNKEKLQRKKEDEEGIMKEEELQRKPIFESNAEAPEDDNIQRKCAECEKEGKKNIQAQFETASTETASPSLENRISSSKGSGNSLSPATREEMETSFGADFGHVRIHRDEDAAQMNQDVHSQAFTHGSDIYFNKGKYDPVNKSGKHLLAHELTHVVQQGGATAKKGISRIAERTPVSSVSPKIQRGIVDDVAKYLLTGNAFLDFIVGIVAGIVEWIGDLIMGVYNLFKAAFTGNVGAIIAVVGLIVVIVLTVIFPEVMVPILLVLGIIAGLISIGYYIYMMFRPGLTPYERGKFLGKAIVEALLIALSVAELIKFLKTFAKVSQMAASASLLQRLRWVRILGKAGNLEKILKLLDEVKDIEKTIELIELVKDIDKALELMRLGKNADGVLELLKSGRITVDKLLDILRLGKVDDAAQVKRLLDVTKLADAEQLERLLKHAKIVDGTQLEGLIAKAKLADGAQLERLLAKAKLGDGTQLSRLLDKAKLADGAQLETLLDKAKLADGAQLERLLDKAKLGNGAELGRLLDKGKLFDGAQLERLLDKAKLADGAELERLLDKAKLLDGAQLERLLDKAKLADGAQLERLLDHAKIADGLQLERLLDIPSLADGAQLERLLANATLVDGAQLERLIGLAGNDVPRLENMLNHIGDASDLERFLRAGNGIWEGARAVPPPGATAAARFAAANHGAAQPGFAGNRPYGNNGLTPADMILPRKDAAGGPITYREYDTNRLRPGVGRGAERIVIGSDGRTYYTADHYRTFGLF